MNKDKVNIAVFISGRGSNLKALIINSKKKKFNFKVALVISNNKNAKGLSHAKNNKIPYFIFENFDSKLIVNKIFRIVKKERIKLICLAGFMKILNPYFINKFKKKIINIHPSLLPKFKGLNTHQRVLKAKEKYTGCSVHFVSKKMDDGKIILKKKLKIKKKDTKKTLEIKVLKLEYEAYSKAVEKVIANFKKKN